jgi:hypothetical protein
MRHVVFSNDVDVCILPLGLGDELSVKDFSSRCAILLVALALMFDGHWILQSILTSAVCRRTCAEFDGTPDKARSGWSPRRHQGRCAVLRGEHRDSWSIHISDSANHHAPRFLCAASHIRWAPFEFEAFFAKKNYSCRVLPAEADCSEAVDE